MTQQYPHGQSPTSFDQGGYQPPKKSHTLRTVLIVLACVGVAAIGGFTACAAIVGSAIDESTKPNSVASTYPADIPTSTGPTVVESTKTTPPARVLGVKDLVPSLKVTDKQCFGSAGCNVRYRVSLTVKGTQMPAETDSYEVTYEVRGGEDGAVVGSTVLEGLEYDRQEDMVSTKSSKTKLSVVITSVEKLS